MLYRFHVNLFARPQGLMQSFEVELRGQRLSAIRAADGRPLLFDAPLPLSFEEGLAALVKLPRVDAEPDGFFVLSGEHDGRRWQVDGHLFDFDDRLHRVELHGECPREAFDGLLGCFGGPRTPLAFELVQEGVALEEDAFRLWAAATC
jgi:hypothetical protein